MSSKRTFEGHLPSPQKITKMDVDSIKAIKSNIFVHDEDHKQFQEIYNSVNEAQIVTNMNISSDICKVLAEYSTGTVKDCANCEEEISVLHGDKSEFKRCDKSDKYWCTKCMSNVIRHKCSGDCNNYLFGSNEYTECASYFCAKIIVHECVETDTVTCRTCGNMYCELGCIPHLYDCWKCGGYVENCCVHDKDGEPICKSCAERFNDSMISFL